MSEDENEPSKATYPRRPRFFSHRFTRLMARVCLANEIGPEACWLLAVIVNTEDAKGYRGPVTYFNDQLMNVTGFGSVPSLDRFRSKAVAAGWLHYEPGVRRRAGVYWVTIPDDCDGVKDGPIDHDENDYRESIPSTNGTLEKTSAAQPDPIHSAGGSYPEGKRKETVQESGRKAEGNRSPIFPSPFPNPNPKTEEIAAEPPKPKSVPVVEAIPKPRNQLFDAIADVSGLDPRTAGGVIGKVAAVLGKANYTLEEVKEFGQRFWEFCPYAAESKRDRPTPTELQKYIGLIRASPAPKQIAPQRSAGRAGVVEQQIDTLKDWLREDKEKLQ